MERGDERVRRHAQRSQGEASARPAIDLMPLACKAAAGSHQGRLTDGLTHIAELADYLQTILRSHIAVTPVGGGDPFVVAPSNGMQIRFKPYTTPSKTLRTSAAVGGDGAALQRLRRAAGVGVARHRCHRVGRRGAGWPVPLARPPRPGADLLSRTEV